MSSLRSDLHSCSVSQLVKITLSQSPRLPSPCLEIHCARAVHAIAPTSLGGYRFTGFGSNFTRTMTTRVSRSRSRSRSPTFLTSPSRSPSSTGHRSVDARTHSEGASSPNATPDRIVSPRGSHMSSPSTSRHTLGNELVVVPTLAENPLATLALEPATVPQLQLRIAEMSASQQQLQRTHAEQLQSMLNKEHQSARSQDVYLKRASEARSRDRGRIEQLMRDKNELTASQLAQGADDIRATQNRILANEADSVLQASQAA